MRNTKITEEFVVVEKQPKKKNENGFVLTMVVLGQPNEFYQRVQYFKEDLYDLLNEGDKIEVTFDVNMNGPKGVKLSVDNFKVIK